MKYLVQVFDWHTEKFLFETIAVDLNQVSLIQNVWYDRGYVEWEILNEG